MLPDIWIYILWIILLVVPCLLEVGNCSLEQHALIRLPCWRLSKQKQPDNSSFAITLAKTLSSFPYCQTRGCRPVQEGSAMPQQSLSSAEHLGRPNLKGPSFQSSSTGSLTVPAGWLPPPPGTLPLKHSRHNSQTTEIVSRGTSRASSSPRDMAPRGIPWMAGQGPCWRPLPQHPSEVSRTSLGWQPGPTKRQ